MRDENLIITNEEGEMLFSISLKDHIKEEVKESVLNFLDRYLDNEVHKIEDLDLSPHAYNVLYWHHKIRTVEQLTVYTKREIQNMRSVGRKTYEEIITKTHELGYRFVDE